jgi:hypothetical protein
MSIHIMDEQLIQRIERIARRERREEVDVIAEFGSTHDSPARAPWGRDADTPAGAPSRALGSGSGHA